MLAEDKDVPPSYSYNPYSAASNPFPEGKRKRVAKRAEKTPEKK